MDKYSQFSSFPYVIRQAAYKVAANSSKIRGSKGLG